MIFCFSGTGNSRYIAKSFKEELQEEIIDLNEKIKENDNSSIKTEEDVIVVTPTYAWRIPRVVTKWLLKTEFIGAKRIWFVMSCGDEIGNASKYNEMIAKQKKLQYMGIAMVIMPENYIAMYDVPSVKEAIEIVKKAKPDIEKAITCIKKKQVFEATGNSLKDRFKSDMINSIFYNFIVKATPFKANDNCVGCGKCVKNCPLNNIELKGNKPIWGNNCTHCMACICYCPSKAIEYGNKSVGKPRYHFEGLKIK